MNLGLAASIFGFIFVAELPDKTAIASLVLATRFKPLVVFAGAALAFIIQSLVAILVGGLFSLLPEAVVHRVAGALFLVFAFFMWRDAGKNEDAEEEETIEKEIAGKKQTFWAGMWTAFIVVFLAEWGDLTQLATATLEAKYRDPVTVFIGATLALWAVSAIAIVIGSRVRTIFNPEITKKIAAVIFALLGVALVIGIL
ncbi:MAG: TMEM165/GDT1 family protein [Chloroflexi bacterium]|nr:TMEM165/GDT1 family protein [Chloroflexota bacterium]